MKQFLNNALEIVLFAILAITPFSFQEISFKWILLLILSSTSLMYLYIFQKKNNFNISNFGIILAVLMMLLFGFAEKVNFIQQLSIPIVLKMRLPMSTLLLATGMLIFGLKVLFTEKLQITGNYFAKYFFYSCLIMSATMILFYPFLFYNYRMNFDLDGLLLNHILKYLMILFLVTNYVSNTKRIKRINFVFTASMSVTVILWVLFRN